MTKWVTNILTITYAQVSKTSYKTAVATISREELLHRGVSGSNFTTKSFLKIGIRKVTPQNIMKNEIKTRISHTKCLCLGGLYTDNVIYFGNGKTPF